MKFSSVFMVALAVVPTIAFAQVGQVSFSYQGRVKVQGQPYNGSGQFKFAILNTSATTSLWSNDNTSAGGGQPAAFISLTVADGIFDAIVGDAAIGMSPINSTIFQSATPLKLRIWFNDGTHGFQQLNPDHNLVNLTLNTIQTGQQDFTIYVNGTTGNDANNGLTPDNAKKTIQAAVDTLPSRIKCNVTIDVADGTYPEQVKVNGISVDPDKKLKFLGDDSWTPASAGNPGVVITAADGVTSGVRSTGMTLTFCNNVEIRGFQFQNASDSGLRMENGAYDVLQCRASGSFKAGIQATQQSTVNITSCTATANNEIGFYIYTSSRATIKSCKGLANASTGLAVIGHCNCRIGGAQSDYANNGNSTAGTGITIVAMCDVGFMTDFSGFVRNNGKYGAQVSWMSYFDNQAQGTWSGNPSGSFQIFNNSYVY